MANEHFVEMQYSDDGGHNWTNMRLGDLGDPGAYSKRVIFWRLGATRQRVWRVRISGPIKADLLAAEVMTQQAAD